MVAIKLVLVETSSKVALVLLLVVTHKSHFHVECLPQALALDPSGPLVTLRVSLY